MGALYFDIIYHVTKMGPSIGSLPSVAGHSWNYLLAQIVFLIVQESRLNPILIFISYLQGFRLHPRKEKGESDQTETGFLVAPQKKGNFHLE